MGAGLGKEVGARVWIIETSPGVRFHVMVGREGFGGVIEMPWSYLCSFEG